MRPNHPEWSCNTSHGLYPERMLLKPCTDIQQVHAVKIGPLARGDSQGSLNNRWWLCYQEGNSVLLRGAVDTVYWSATVEVFTETGTITRIDFTFDQQGREIIFYQVGTELRLWYFDPIAAAFTKRVIETVASQPTCGFDLINDTSDPMSDAHLFYVKNDTIFERLQRDRYDVVYDTNVGHPGITITSCGMTSGNVFECQYLYETDGLLDKPKVYQTAGPVITNFNTDDFEIGFDIGPNFNSRCMPRDANGEVSATFFEHSQSFSNVADTNILVTMIYPQDVEFPYLGIFSQVLNVPLQYVILDKHFYKGSYRFVFGPGTTSSKKNFKYYRDGVLVFDGDVDKPLLPPDSTSQHSLKFGAADAPLESGPTYWKALPAQFLNMYSIVNGVRTDWPITTGAGDVTSVPPGNNMTLYVDGKDGVRIF